MKSDLFWLSIPVSLINLFISSNIAIAAYFNPLTGYSEADLAREINNGIFVEEFNAISNIVPPQTVDEKFSSKKQFLGKNGEKVDFQRSFDGEILKYQVDKEVLNAINVNEAGFDINGMILSAISTKKWSDKII